MSDLPGVDLRPTDPALAWRRLVRTLTRRPGRAQLVVALLLAALGFAIATQVRATAQSGLSSLRPSELVGVLDDVTQRQARLQAEQRSLEATRQQLAEGSSAAALAEARARARTLGVLAGTLPASGPGIVLTVTDPRAAVRYPVLLDALEELRDAGAEAIEIGDAETTVRVGTTTWLADGRGGVTVDGTQLSPPYRLTVIGDPATLAAALGIPGGVLDELGQAGAHGAILQRHAVQISAVRTLPAPRYATPVPAPAP